MSGCDAVLGVQGLLAGRIHLATQVSGEVDQVALHAHPLHGGPAAAVKIGTIRTGDSTRPPPYAMFARA
jgi:hypothetical protein